MDVLHSFSIQNNFYDKMFLRLFYFYVTIFWRHNGIGPLITGWRKKILLVHHNYESLVSKMLHLRFILKSYLQLYKIKIKILAPPARWTINQKITVEGGNSFD